MSLLKRLTPILTLIAVCWLVFGLNHFLFQDHLNQFGIIPRHPASLPGILWAPFLHSSIQHLLANTLPMAVLGVILCVRSQREFYGAAVVGILVGGALTWLLGRPGCHIGASGLVFCWFGYLTSLAYFRRTIGTLLISVVCLLAYGGMLRGVLPSSMPISWEGHLAGLVAGITLAGASSRRGQRGTA